MVKKSLYTTLVALAATAAVTSPALAKGGTGGGGGGGGGGTTPVLATPAIAPGTFDGIGSGPVYVRESFGFAQRTRYKQNGSIIDVVDKPDINGIRAEYPNNKTESWIGTTVSGSPSWRFATVGPADSYEPYTPLQDGPNGYQDGIIQIVGAEVGTPDTRPNALLPFDAPADSAYTVSGDVTAILGKTAIGFSNSSAANQNFETNGQAWLELDTSGLYAIGGNTGIVRWTFHTNGLDGATLSGTYQPGANGFNRAAVSYDPVNQVASATVDGNVVASVPYAAQSIKYVGVEGSLHANVDNFSVRTGTVTDPQ